MDKQTSDGGQVAPVDPKNLSRRAALKRMAAIALGVTAAASVAGCFMLDDDDDGGAYYGGGGGRSYSYSSGGYSSYSYSSEGGYYSSQFDHTYASINVSGGNSYSSTNLYASSGYYTSHT